MNGFLAQSAERSPVKRMVSGSSPEEVANREVAEWLIAPDCKSGPNGLTRRFESFPLDHGLVAQSVERGTENPCAGSSILSQATK